MSDITARTAINNHNYHKRYKDHTDAKDKKITSFMKAMIIMTAMNL